MIPNSDGSIRRQAAPSLRCRALLGSLYIPKPPYKPAQRSQGALCLMQRLPQHPQEGGPSAQNSNFRVKRGHVGKLTSATVGFWPIATTPPPSADCPSSLSAAVPDGLGRGAANLCRGSGGGRSPQAIDSALKPFREHRARAPLFFSLDCVGVLRTPL